MLGFILALGITKGQLVTTYIHILKGRTTPSWGPFSSLPYRHKDMAKQPVMKYGGTISPQSGLTYSEEKTDNISDQGPVVESEYALVLENFLNPPRTQHLSPTYPGPVTPVTLKSSRRPRQLKPSTLVSPRSIDAQTRFLVCFNYDFRKGPICFSTDNPDL